MTESKHPKKKQPLGQSIGGVLFGFEQAVFRNQPPPHELVHHARPDDPVPAADGGFLAIDIPGDTGPDPLAGLARDLAEADAGATHPAAHPDGPASDPDPAATHPASDPEEG